MIKDANGKESKLEYDEDHNLLKMHLPNEGIAAWAYDPWGQSIQAINPDGKSQRFVYDKLGRVQKIYHPDGNIINLQYSAYDEVLHVNDDHHSVNFEYTPLGTTHK